MNSGLALANLAGAERELKKALEYTQRPSTRSMYEAKLSVLNQNAQGAPG